MFNKILAPLDGSSLAECVLPHLTSIATASRATVTLLRVVEASSLPDPLACQMRRAEAQSYLEGARQRLAEAGVRAKTILLEGSVARHIAEYADTESYDLLVLSTHGRGGLAPWSAGSVAQKVIQGLRTSLFLVRAFESQAMQEQTPLRRSQCRRIMLALDGSQRAEAALPHAAMLADRWGAELLMAHVVARPACFRNTPCAGESATIAETLVERNVFEAREYLHRLKSRVDVLSRVRVVVGSNVMLGLHELAEKEEVDLIVISAHGQGCNRRHRYGSVATETILYGSAPLLVFQDMQPEQIEATAVERWVQAGEALGRWRPLEEPRLSAYM